MAFFNKDNKFDIQLSAAEIAEKRLADVLCSVKIELKTEAHIWEKTGNIAIEYECNGKPSGISTTKADFWAHELSRDGETHCVMLFPIEKIKAIARQEFKKDRIVSGGDRNASKMILVPLARLIQ